MYLTVAEADTYFATRLDSDVWAAATPERKAAALTVATQTLDNLEWVGMIRVAGQELAWPRVGYYFDPRAGYHIELDDQVPKRIKTACAEMALHLLTNKGLLDSTGSLTELTVGPITLKGMTDVRQTPPHVYDGIRPLLTTAGGNGRGGMWWRAN